MKLALLLFVLCCGAAFGQSNGDKTQPGNSPATVPDPPDKNLAPKPPEKGKVIGQVVNEATGEPLKKASIMAWRSDGNGGDSMSATTDAAGKYHFDDLEPGKYTVTANRTGFVSQKYGTKNPNGAGTALSVGPGGTVEAIFKLTPHSVITGRVVDEDNDPVANVQVRLSRYFWQNGKRALMPSESGYTNDLGEYRIYGVAPGKYYLSATYNPHQWVSRVTDGADDEYAPVYYPGATDPRGATQLEVPKANQLRGVDLTLRKTRSFRVRGRVISNIPGQSKPGRLSVSMMPKAEDTAWMWDLNKMTPTDADGKFEFHGVTPGAYEITANLYGGAERFHGKEDVSVAQESVNGVTVTLAPGWDMKGTLRVDGDAKDPNLGQIHLSLTSEDGGPMRSSGASAMVKDDGAFTFPGVSSERCRLTAWGLPEGYYIKSARAGSTDLLEHPADMGQLQGASIEVVLSPKGAAVEGAVKNDRDEAVTDATIVLIPEAAKRSNHALFLRTTVDQYGHFKITGVTPGAYSIYAFKDVEPGIWEDPEFLQTIEKQAVDLTLSEGSHESKDLKVISETSLTEANEKTAA